MGVLNIITRERGKQKRTRMAAQEGLDMKGKGYKLKNTGGF